MKNASPALVMVLALATSLAGTAQTPKPLQPNERPTNLAGVTTIDAPPEGFDPVSASDAELAYHGFPPRPDQYDNPKAYESWARAMKASKTRLAPTLEQTNIFHGPAKLNQKVSEPGTLSNGLSSNSWSGYLASGGTTYGSSAAFYYVYSEFVVPYAQQAFGVCNGGWDTGTSWVGIDGYGSGDVLQAGVEFDAYCNGATRSTYYSPWYEWYPFSAVRITSLTVAPRDEIWIEVWSTTATQGYAYIVDETTGHVVEVGFAAPAGTRLVGNSAEWILEGFGGNALSPPRLTNYVEEPFWDAYAVTFGGTAIDPGSASAQTVTMYDGATPVSVPTLLGPSAFLMLDFPPVL